jgi:hypothetical protein
MGLRNRKGCQGPTKDSSVTIIIIDLAWLPFIFTLSGWSFTYDEYSSLGYACIYLDRFFQLAASFFRLVSTRQLCVSFQKKAPLFSVAALRTSHPSPQ